MSSQSYGSPASRNTMRAAGGDNNVFTNGDKGTTGSGGAQGAGMIPGKVSVPMPSTNTVQPDYKGGMKGTIDGFSGNGIIPGKI